eukprot:CAMPEP_0119327052 /NCGR_PEP_ID=MMETSP1333-20130426/69825_1 /TAXON_ID=418940 /ORGANISM="Scyphosphaera apsteinii, Strain RCC1455" /LENGTH=277 /DNA_ID=CAMNT_0007335529 /DNA_START=1 /DNA_END=834 /DNA_ORIENTATION=+
MARCCDGNLQCDAVLVSNPEDVCYLHSWEHGSFGELFDPVAAEQSKRGCGACELIHLQERHASGRPICLHLSLMEALHLVSKGTLQIWQAHQPSEVADSRGTLLSEAVCWQLFAANSLRFPYEYAAYCALRTAGWVVRSGVTFGADFSLYAPTAERKAHAMLCALVAVPSLDPQRNWCWLQQHVRLCHHVAKGLLLCEVATSDTQQQHGECNLAELSGRACLARLDVRMLRVATWSPAKAHAASSSTQHHAPHALVPVASSSGLGAPNSELNEPIVD